MSGGESGSRAPVTPGGRRASRDEGPDAAIETLEERLRRHPAERYPVQHATAQFHLGVALTDAGRLDEAQTALATAAGLFDRDQLPLEHAKALNALGAALRMAGADREAASAFAHAAAAFKRSDAGAEQGAALFNLGLVRRDAGDATAAVEAFGEARRLLVAARAGAQAAAAARELGATHFAAGDVELAAGALEQAVELARKARDAAGLGAAANGLGLVRLADGRTAEAVEALETALAGHPRSLRPEEFAMVKANLALAHEQAGDELRARLAARQALGVPAAPEPVRAQAAGVAERLGGGPGDVLLLLDEEPAQRWPGVLRDELARWADAEAGERRAGAAAWIDAQLARATAGVELSEALLGALLELPPAPMEAVIRSLVEALGDRDGEDRERFRAQTAMGMARFNVPQLLRLRDIFNRIATELGQEAAWT